METSNSDSNHVVLHAQNNRWGLGHIETCNSGPNVAVLHAIATNEGWDQERLVILKLKSLFWMHKTTDEGWDQ